MKVYDAQETTTGVTPGPGGIPGPMRASLFSKTPDSEPGERGAKPRHATKSVTGMAPNLAVNQGPLMGYMVRFHGSALNFVADPIFRM